MVNVVIYYQQKENEDPEETVQYIDSLVQQLERQYIIKGVYIDQFNNQSEFFDLLNSPLSDIQYIYLEKDPQDAFDKQLIYELAKAEGIKIRFLDSI